MVEIQRNLTEEAWEPFMANMSGFILTILPERWSEAACLLPLSA
jgi:hypothetical protein